MNNLGIESGTCTWATAVNTWSKKELDQSHNEITIYSPQVFKSKLMNLLYKFMLVATETAEHGSIRRKSQPCVVLSHGFTNGPLITSPLPQDYVSEAALPKNWDWRNIDGINYLSWTVNQHIPQYCGSCWAQGTLSALADRFIVADRHKFANIALSPQVILNCRAGGSCEGGAPGEVYEFLSKIGVPDMTCQQYDAKDHVPVEDCSKPDINICRDCSWPPPPPGEQGNCRVVQNFTRYYVKEYGAVRGAANMKKEIYKRGPIGE